MSEAAQSAAPAPGTASATTLRRGSPDPRDLGSFKGRRRSPGIRNTWVPWICVTI